MKYNFLTDEQLLFIRVKMRADGFPEGVGGHIFNKPNLFGVKRVVSKFFRKVSFYIFSIFSLVQSAPIAVDYLPSSQSSVDISPVLEG